jgi:hypothetical protein
MCRVAKVIGAPFAWSLGAAAIAALLIVAAVAGPAEKEGEKQ